ncbi:hypothetical protein EMPS_06048 [Entomortierella parvispora]|uniref:Uncharacterized protein n=1 Tax=Entomortierella parvispora TaxID=205924 RepID=A0A9P3LXB6_9FUNG|nr:hypothetical protein EMPS_06048 [Entomortierella parvispora]
MRATTLFIASAAVLALGTQAQIKGQIASLDAGDNYCFFLPPMIGGDIAANEDKAIAFCNKPNPKAPGAKIFPPGFVLTSHWATGKDWVQITGQIDPVQYELNPCDTGGQYDIKAPVGASCAGFNYFVNVIEPEIGVYGMRCCQVKTDCDVNHSTYGVKRIYGEQYDFSGPRPDGPLPLSLKCVNGALPAGITIPKAGGVATNTTVAPNAQSSSTAPASTSATAPATAPANPNQTNSNGGAPDAKVASKGTSAGVSNTVMMSTTVVVASVVAALLV